MRIYVDDPESLEFMQYKFHKSKGHKEFQKDTDRLTRSTLAFADKLKAELTARNQKFREWLKETPGGVIHRLYIYGACYIDVVDGTVYAPTALYRSQSTKVYAALRAAKDWYENEELDARERLTDAMYFEALAKWIAEEGHTIVGGDFEDLKQALGLDDKPRDNPVGHTADLQDLRDMIERFVIEHDQELRDLGSIYGHCAVASAAFWIVTRNNPEIFPRVVFQRLQCVEDSEKPPHFRLRVVASGDVYDPTSYQFKDGAFDTYQPSSSAGVQSIRKDGSRYTTVSPATQLILDAVYTEFPEYNTRRNSKGLVVSHAPIEDALEDLRRYVWDHWNDLQHSQDEVVITYEIPYTELDGSPALMPVDFRLTEKDEDFPAGSYFSNTHSVTLWVPISGKSRHAQVYNPNKEHPRWVEFRTYLTSTLVHELTHALDPNEELRRKRNRYDSREAIRCFQDLDNLTPECRGIVERYLNIPIELSAFINEIVYEIVTASGERLPSRLEDALNLSEKWAEIEPFLSEKSKQTAYKRIYTRLYSGDVTL